MGNLFKSLRWCTFVVQHNLFQFHSVAQSRQTLCDPMDCSTPGFPVHHQLPELTQTHVHWVSDAIQPSHPLSSPSSPIFNLFQHQGLFQWVSSSHQVAKVLKFQLQHQSFQWKFKTDFLKDGMVGSPCIPIRRTGCSLELWKKNSKFRYFWERRKRWLKNGKHLRIFICQIKQ